MVFMNELLFFFHTLTLLFVIYIFSKLGKEGLITVFVLQGLIANLFILKQISLFGLDVTTTDCYTIGSFITLNLLREKYGNTISNQAITIGICSIVFLPLMSLFLLSYQSTLPNLKIDGLYEQILTPSFRIFFVSLACTLLFQKMDTHLFAQFRKKVSFQLSMFLSISISQLFDTLFFTYFALSGLLENLISIFIFSFIIKSITIALMTTVTKVFIRRAS
jgi:uncharacterized integral membrane protein (TIGR00697 family)